jgi:hypothetical protein
MRYGVRVSPWELLSRPVPLSLGLTSARFLTDILLRLDCSILAPCASCLILCLCRVQTHYAVACPSGPVTYCPPSPGRIRTALFHSSEEIRTQTSRNAYCEVSVELRAQCFTDTCRCACFVATAVADRVAVSGARDVQ